MEITRIKWMAAAVVMLAADWASAGPVYQPSGANLTFGDVTHGQRIQSASSNPAAAAADAARRESAPLRGTVLSAAAGLEYGNVQELFDLYDRITRAYAPSDPGTGGGPGQNPGDKPDGGINIGDILDQLDPDVTAALNAIAREVAVQTALLGLVATEGYGKAWVTFDAPFVMEREYLGGTWSFGLNWSGSAKAYGIAEPIEFDVDEARTRIENWLNTLPIDRPVQLPISDDIILTPGANAVLFQIRNDSSIVSKSSRSTEFDVGYSRQAMSGAAGALYLGAEAHLYVKQLSRISVRFGDITDSKELFDSIRNADYRSDTRMGVDIGALWVGENYQLGAQVTNVNEPKFVFPDVNLSPYNSELIIGALERDKVYRMDRQLKLEASLFSKSRRWSAHLGYDADPATDPMGDRFQWVTVSAGLATDKWWMPSARMGYRKNLAGTEIGYLGIGATVLKYVNIDISSALDSVKIDGRNLPQGLMMSIGFDIAW